MLPDGGGSVPEQIGRLEKEVDAYRTLGEFTEKAQHYSANPEQARAIAERGHERVRRDHTIAHRLDTTLSTAGLA